MLPCSRVDPQTHKLYLKYQDIPIDYLEKIPEENPEQYTSLQILDEKIGKQYQVHIKRGDLRNLGISVTTFDDVKNNPEGLLGMLQTTAIVNRKLTRAFAFARENLPVASSRYFTNNIIPFMNRCIHLAWHMEHDRPSSEKDVPGVYLTEGKIFINAKGAGILGEGAFGKIKMSLEVSASNETLTLIAKKTLGPNQKPEYVQSFKDEIEALSLLRNQKGIINMIAGGEYDGKYAIFLPLYDRSLYHWRKTPSFSLSMGERVKIISGWLAGLNAIAKIGVHEDLSPKNLLFKKENAEGVIADFGSFRKHGSEEFGITTPGVCSPEYFQQTITSKNDVWAMGLALHEMTSGENQISSWYFFQEKKVKEWTKGLESQWILKYPILSETPAFLINLTDRMLEPNHENRISAGDSFEYFTQQSQTLPSS